MRRGVGYLLSSPHVKSNCRLMKLSLSGLSLVNIQECGAQSNIKDIVEGNIKDV